MQYSERPPRAVVETRDSLGPIVAPERTNVSPANGAVARAARAGAIGGLVASLLAGVPYYLAVRGALELPWAQLAPTFVAFVTLTGALYGAGAARGLEIFAARSRAHGRAARALAEIAGATLGAAVVGPAPGSLGLAYFGSLPYPFIGTSTLAVAPFVGTAFASFGLAAAAGSRRRAALAALVPATLFCVAGLLALGPLDDESVVAMFRSATTSAGHEDSALGLGIVGLGFGALLGVGLGAQMGISAALAGRRVTSR